MKNCKNLGPLGRARGADIDCDTDGDIWGSTNGALLRFAALIAAMRCLVASKLGDTITLITSE